MNIPKICLVLCLVTSLITGCKPSPDKGFVQSRGAQFTLRDKPYYYIGTNYWYAGLLGLNADGKQRLQKELDFLQAQGITNLRVVAAVEGQGLINGVPRIEPPTQPQPNVFDDQVMIGMDYLLSEMHKRNMKAVLYLSNNWDWSGGFLQYLNWNGILSDSIMQGTLSWDAYRDYVSQFYTCMPCLQGYRNQVERILNRTNSITRNKYIEDPTIMAWELANEPRPMRPIAIDAYKKWIAETAAFIKSKDSIHLITIGTEGFIGTEDAEVYENIHADKNIDYLTLHIWPKNWEWFSGTDLKGGFDSVIFKTHQYIDQHILIAKKLNKPLVIEEFGLPRDDLQFTPGSSTGFRDRYFEMIFEIWKQNQQQKGAVAGLNFWAFGGMANPIHGQPFWKPGDDYMGDPPMEEQGLNTVFSKDSSTWKLIRSYTGSNR